MIHRWNGAELLVIIKTLCNKVSEIVWSLRRWNYTSSLQLPNQHCTLPRESEESPSLPFAYNHCQKTLPLLLQGEDGNLIGKHTKKLKWIKTTSQLRIPDRNSRDHLGTPPRYPMKGRDKMKLRLTFIVHEFSYSVWHIQIGSDS